MTDSSAKPRRTSTVDPDELVLLDGRKLSQAAAMRDFEFRGIAHRMAEGRLPLSDAEALSTLIRAILCGAAYVARDFYGALQKDGLRGTRQDLTADTLTTAHVTAMMERDDDEDDV